VIRVEEQRLDSMMAVFRAEEALRRDTFAPATRQAWEKALALKRTLLREGKKDAYTYFDVGYCLMHLGRFDEAIEAFEESVRLKPSRSETWAYLGLASSKAGRRQQAAEAFKRAVRPDPADPETNLGWVSWLTREREEVVIQVLTDYLTTHPEDSHAHYVLAVMHERKGRNCEAMTEYERMAQTNPHDASLRFCVGAAYSRLGETGRARLWCDHPTEIVRRIDLWAKAAEHYQAAIQVRPDYAEAQDGLVVPLRKLGRWQEAWKARAMSIALYKKRITDNAKDSRARYNLALIYIRLGDRQAARKQYEALRRADEILAIRLRSRIEYPRLGVVRTGRGTICSQAGRGEVYFRATRGCRIVVLDEYDGYLAVLMQGSEIGWIAKSAVALGGRL
jgi:tetratricopeptide (TPR) repeat protein